jgi:hypothetical protein
MTAVDDSIASAARRDVKDGELSENPMRQPSRLHAYGLPQ